MLVLTVAIAVSVERNGHASLPIGVLGVSASAADSDIGLVSSAEDCSAVALDCPSALLPQAVTTADATSKTIGAMHFEAALSA
jgi:hypothetical protein